MYFIQENANSRNPDELLSDLKQLLSNTSLNSGSRADLMKSLFRRYAFSILENSADTDIFIDQLNQNFDGMSNYSTFESEYIDKAERLIGIKNFDVWSSVYHTRLMFQIDSLLKSELMQEVLRHNPNVFERGILDYDLGKLGKIVSEKAIDIDLGIESFDIEDV